ncbi:hypothetical protein V6N13_102543 [Hibiscus sabdariffa]
MRTDPMSDSSYNFSYVSNENESYFLYSIHDSSTITKLFMYVSGQIEQMTWLESRKQWNLFYAAQPIQQCEVYAFCGAFGICNDKSQPFCSCLTGFQPTSQQNWSQQVYSEGCVRKTKLQCGNASVGTGSGDRFLESRYMTCLRLDGRHQHGMQINLSRELFLYSLCI